jgi:hypothetical protein
MEASPGSNISTGQTSIGTTATQLTTKPAGSNGRASGGVMITNIGAATVFISSANTVTTANGHALPAGASISLPLDDPSRIWCIVAAGTNIVTYAYVT